MTLLDNNLWRHAHATLLDNNFASRKGNSVSAFNVLESETGKYLENTSRFSDVSATMFPSLAKYYLYIHVV